MAEFEWSEGQTTIIQGDATIVEFKWSEGQTTLDWKWVSGIYFYAVSFDGLITI